MNIPSTPCPLCGEPCDERGGKIGKYDCYHPREYQRIISAQEVRLERTGIWADMGTGKTVASLTAIDSLHFAGLIQRVLVVAPLRVAQTTWPDEAEKWYHLRNVVVIPIVGSAAKRERLLAQFLPGQQVGDFVTVETRPQVYTINYENLPWLIKKLGKGNWPFDMVIADESTKLKGFRLNGGTERAKAMARPVIWKKINRFVELTGTPSPNGLQDLWGQAWFLDGGERLMRTYEAFKERWFYPKFDEYGISPHAHTQGDIEKHLKDIVVSIRAADYFDVKKPIPNTIYVDLPKEVRLKYRDMEREMFMQIQELVDNNRGAATVHDIEAVNAASRTMKCLQLASGAAYLPQELDEDGKPIGPRKWVEMHDAKIKALEDILEEAAGMPVLVAYHFKSDLVRLKKAFPKGRELDKNPQTQRDWNEGKIPVMFAHPASAGHGLNLQDGGNIVVFFSHDWNLEFFQQIIERIGPVRQIQAGHDRPVFIHYIVARDTVDEMVMERREGKKEVQEILLEAMKHKGIIT